MLERKMLSHDDALNKLSQIAQALLWMSDQLPDGGEILGLLGDDVAECLLVLDASEGSKI